jgi:hypothetical protein
MAAPRTNYPKAEEAIRGILDAFQEAAGFEPGPELRKSWIAGARRLVEDLGEDAAFIPWAVDKMQEAGLMIKSPASTLYLVPEWKATRELRVKYATCPVCFLVGQHADDCPSGLEATNHEA